jgi:hypothetical protein
MRCGSVFDPDARNDKTNIFMWKALNHGDSVFVGNNIRYRSKSNQPHEGEIYIVVKTDQHYFEIVKKADQDDVSEPPPRKVVRLIDVGYNVLLERWSEPQEAPHLTTAEP